MTTVDNFSKASDTAGHLASGINTLIESSGDTMQIISGCLDMASALTTFLPPPVSTITSTVSGIFNMFLGGGSTDTATAISAEIQKQTDIITNKIESLKGYFDLALDKQTLEEMKFLAGVSKLIRIMTKDK